MASDLLVNYYMAGTAPNGVVRIQVVNKGDRSVILDTELGKPDQIAQTMFELEVTHNLQQERGSKGWKRLMTRCRKGLGFSYPEMI